MKCKSCGRSDVPDGAAFCCWCGRKIVKTRKKSAELKVPVPRQLPSGSWFIQLRLGGESIPITAGTERECLETARAVKAGLIETKKKQPAKTVGQAIDEYIAGRDQILSPATLRTYKHIRRYRFQGIMDLDVSKLTPEILQSALNQEAADIKPKTLKNAWGLLKSALSPYTDAVNRKFTFPQPEPRDVQIYDREQLRTLFAACQGDDVELAVLLAACLGLRRSEILALEYSDFDRRAKTVTINKARVPDEHNQLVLKGTKTVKSTRTLPCPDYILDKVPKGKSGYIYEGHQQNYLQGRLRAVCKRAGLPEISLHKLRHTNASVMLALNVPDKYAMERGGWSNNQTMKRIYQHTISEEKQKTDATINDFFSDLVG